MVRVRATYVRRVAEMLRVRAAYECCACACIPGKPILSCRYPQAGHSEVDLRAVGELAEPAPLSLFGLGPTPHSLSGLGPPPTLTPWPDPESTPPSLTHSIHFTQIVISMLSQTAYSWNQARRNQLNWFLRSSWFQSLEKPNGVFVLEPISVLFAGSFGQNRCTFGPIPFGS